MVQRELRTKPELEELCLMALQGHLGLNHLDHVKIGPYSGPMGWSWELVEAGPDCLELYSDEIAGVLRTFQENFDLKTRRHRAAPGERRRSAMPPARA